MPRLLLLLSLLICAVTTHAADEKKLLIIGNSYTFYNDLPELLQAMADADGTPLTVDSYTAGAMSLRGFLDSPRHAEGRRKLESGDYDYLLLQDQSQTPAYKPDETLDSVKRWCDLARLHKTKPILFLTWAHAVRAEGKVKLLTAMQDDTSLTYCKAAVANKARVAPAGEAWRRWYAKHPGDPLHLPDMSHPTDEGSYLAACVIYSTITGKKATGIPVRLKGAPVRIPPARARELQKIAAATLKTFTPAGYLKKHEESNNKLLSATEARDLLTRDITATELTEALGKPTLVQKNGKQITYQYRLRDNVEFVAYCNSRGKVLNVSISDPAAGVSIIDLSELKTTDRNKKSPNLQK